MAVAAGADGDHRRLVQHDALAADVNQGVGRAQVDGKIVGEQAAQLLEHRESLMKWGFGRPLGYRFRPGRTSDSCAGSPYDSDRCRAIG